MDSLIIQANQISTYVQDIDNAIIAKGGQLINGGKLKYAASAIEQLSSSEEYPKEWTHDYTEVIIDLRDAVGELSTLLSVQWMINVIDSTAGITVYYGDGESKQLSTAGNLNIAHVYSSPGKYTLRITSEKSGLTWRFHSNGIVYFSNNVLQYEGCPWTARIRGIGIGTNCKIAADDYNCPLQFVGPCWVCINKNNTSTGNINTYDSNGWAGYSQIRYFSGWPSGITNVQYSSVNPQFGPINDNQELDIFNDNISAINQYQFYENRNSSFKLPLNLVILPYECFYGCYALQKITLPSNITTIYGGCFYQCHSLQYIEIPSKVTSIDGWHMFSSCHCLSSVIVRSKSPPTLTRIYNMFDTAGWYVPGQVVNVKIPLSTKDAYEADTNWAAIFALTNIVEETWDDTES